MYLLDIYSINLFLFIIFFIKMKIDLRLVNAEPYLS